MYTYRPLVRPYAIELKLLVHEAKPNACIPPSALTCHISTLMDTHKKKSEWVGDSCSGDGGGQSVMQVGANL